MIVTYAMLINVFFVLMELFTALYSNIPEHAEHFKFLFVGLAGNATLVPWMWTSAALSVAALVLLVNPKTRHNETTLAAACVAVFVGLWIEKGLGLIIAGFEPSPLGKVTVYAPTLPEILISLGIYAFGLVLITRLLQDRPVGPGPGRGVAQPEPRTGVRGVVAAAAPKGESKWRTPRGGS